MSTNLYNMNAPKKSTHLSINSDLLRQAREYGINLSRALEERLVEILLEEKRRRWQKENREAIADDIGGIEVDDVFREGWRKI
jgi:antitoxin CcdA